MIIDKIVPSLGYNRLLKRLDTLNKITNRNSIKVIKVVKPTNKKMLPKTLGTNVINSPMSPSSLRLLYKIITTRFCYNN